MPRPTNRRQLMEQMESAFAGLWAEVDALPLQARLSPGACEEWSVKDILAHLDAWHEMFLGWERAGSAGHKPEMPAPGFGWKDTPALNAAIWEKARNDDYDAVVARLNGSYQQVRGAIEAYSDEDLFTKRLFAWTGSTSVGSYAVSATSSHYEWARKLIRKHSKSLG